MMSRIYVCKDSAAAIPKVDLDPFPPSCEVNGRSFIIQNNDGHDVNIIYEIICVNDAKMNRLGKVSLAKGQRQTVGCSKDGYLLFEFYFVWALRTTQYMPNDHSDVYQSMVIVPRPQIKQFDVINPHYGRRVWFNYTKQPSGYKGNWFLDPIDMVVTNGPVYVADSGTTIDHAQWAV
jgi:hypothetical protein